MARRCGEAGIAGLEMEMWEGGVAGLTWEGWQGMGVVGVKWDCMVGRALRG